MARYFEIRDFMLNTEGGNGKDRIVGYASYDAFDGSRGKALQAFAALARANWSGWTGTGSPAREFFVSGTVDKDSAYDAFLVLKIRDRPDVIDTAAAWLAEHAPELSRRASDLTGSPLHLMDVMHPGENLRRWAAKHLQEMGAPRHAFARLTAEPRKYLAQTA